MSTTFGGDSIAMAAALATLKLLEQPGFYEHINNLGKIQSDGIRKLISKYQLDDILSVHGLPAHAGINFGGHGSLSYLDIQSVYSQTMIQNGVLIFAIYFLNSQHTDKEAQIYLESTEKAFSLIKKAVENDNVNDILLGGKVDPVFKRTIR